MKTQPEAQSLQRNHVTLYILPFVNVLEYTITTSARHSYIYTKTTKTQLFVEVYISQ